MLIALRQDIVCLTLDTSDLSNIVPSIDVVICHCFVGSFAFYIGAVYIPPNTTLTDLELFTDALEVLLLDVPILLIGDFNLPQYIDAGSSCPRTHVLRTFCSLMDFRQYNTIRNINNRVLDLVFCNINNCQVAVQQEILPFVPIDSFHPPISIVIDIEYEARTVEFPSASNARFNYRRANFNQLYYELANTDWSHLEQYMEVNEAVEKFYETFFLICEKSVPLYRTSTRSYPPWFTAAVISALKTKEYYRRKWKSTKSLFYANEFKRLRIICKDQISVAYNCYLEKVGQSIKNNPRELFKFINHKKGKTRIPGTLIHNNITLESPKDIVNAFADIFSQTQINSSITDLPDVVSNKLPFDLLAVSDEELIKIMATFPSNYTAGDDCVPNLIIRDARYVLAKPLRIIINLAIKSATFPDRWKRARISPVFKKGNESILKNYRPISILNNFSKVFEQVIYSSLITNISKYISPHQHGFLPGRSTVTNLVSITQYISQHLDRHGQVDVIYTDLSAAFDSIDHGLLLLKLSALGMCPNFIKLIASYLRNRLNYVQYNGFCSTEFVSTSGVPQGSNLGPLLFLIYVNDLLDMFECPVLAYADDIKIYNAVSSDQDITNLQYNLDTFVEWCSANKLKINISKCCSVTYTRKRKVVHSVYSINSQPITKSQNFYDLGVLFDAELRFSAHIDALCSSTSRKLGFIMRTSKYFMDPELLKSLFFAFVVSSLEYASPVWSPYYLCYQLHIERLQRKFLKYLSFKLDGFFPPRGIDYGQLLGRHNFQSLSSRRDAHGARFVWKLVRGMVDSSFLLSQLNFHVPRQSCRYNSSLSIPCSRTNLSVNSPLYRMARLSNLTHDDIFL